MLGELIETQRQLIDDFFSKLDQKTLEEVLISMESCSGIVFFCGVGKSRWIAQKIAATLTSIGQRSLFLDPLDALHGDIGAVNSEDLVIFLSKSGKTQELLDIAPHLKARHAKTEAWVCDRGTKLGTLVDREIALPFNRELCPFNLAPMTSPTVQLIFGDIIAAALMQRRDLSVREYGSNHPAGTIGKKTQLLVKELMLQGNQVPVCLESDKISAVLAILTEKQCGCLIVVNPEREVLGIVTDGDLRRALQKKGDKVLVESAATMMTRDFLHVQQNTLAIDAKQTMQKKSSRWVNVLPVLNGKHLAGLIRLHDLLNV